MRAPTAASATPVPSAGATLEQRYAALVALLRDDADAPAPPGASRRRFGATALKSGGRIFAMLDGGALVVKLPRPRVEALVEAGTGGRYDPGHGRVMKEWLTVGEGADDATWAALAREALAFVGGRRTP